MPSILLLIYIAFALSAFAANSILCRIALVQGDIDPASFTSIRLVSGAITLMVLVALRAKIRITLTRRRIDSALALFIYAACFSFAYVALDTGVGALVLFGSVQITLVAVALMSGQRLHVLEWFGLAMACMGFIYLVLPSFSGGSIDAPFWAFMLMAVSGIAWGIYTLLGNGSKKPLFDTFAAFVLCVPFVALIMLLSYNNVVVSMQGILLAVSSGALASGIGYALWYRVLPFISTTHTAVLQLLVPVLAALGGVIFVGEPLSQRLIISAVVILIGIASVTYGRSVNKVL